MNTLTRITGALGAASVLAVVAAGPAAASGWYTVSGSGKRSATIARNAQCNCVQYWAGSANFWDGGTFKIVDATNGKTVKSGSWPAWPASGYKGPRGVVYGLYGKYYITGTGGSFNAGISNNLP